MTVTLDSPFKAPPSISLIGWLNAWRNAGALTFTNPLWRGCDALYDTVEEAATALYAYIVRRNQDPNRWLAIGTREHDLGTNEDSVLWRNDTHSLTNARTVRDPALRATAVVIRDKVRGTEYVKYRDIFDSVQDGIYRLEDPTYTYQLKGADTIGEVFALWTEDPAEYGAFVVGFINAHADIGEGQAVTDRDAMMKLLDERFPLKIRIDYIPAGNSNRPGEPANAEGRKWETVHETANLNVGANAEMHRKFVHNGGGSTADYEGVSFHWCVDDHECIGLVPPTEKAWQASDGANGTGNSSESTETCVNADGDWTKTKENLARHLARRIVADPNRSPDRIAQHNHWARDHKNCPTRMRANGGAEWNGVLARVRFILTDIGYFGAPQPLPSDDFRYFPETGHGIGHGFKSYWETNGGLPIFGYPLTDEIQEDGMTVQYFERAVFEFHPENPDPYRVLLRRLGAEALERKAA